MLHLNGQAQSKIVVPFKKQQITYLNIHSESWQIATSDFFLIIDNHYPKNKLFQFLLKTNWILPKNSDRPLFLKALQFLQMNLIMVKQ